MNYMYNGMDFTYLIYILPAFILSLIAQFLVKTRFAKYDKIECKKGVSGAQAAAVLLRSNEINDVKIAHISGNLTDNYNPSKKVLSLSDSTFASRSIAAVGVAAHETGHVIQHHKGYVPLAIRKMLVPVANFGSRFGPLLAVAGIILGFNNGESNLPLFQRLTDIGLILFGGAVLFYIITLPVEFNASRRALKILKETGVFTDKAEIRGARKVLTAAALTYVASALTAIGSFLRLLMIAKGRGRRR